MKCVSYTRVTTCILENDEDSNTIGHQNDRIQAYLQKQNWKLEKRYSDRKNDPNADTAFQQLRRDGVNRKFDLVVVDSIFRCGKNVSYAEDVFLKVFLLAGIQFAVAEDDFCSIGKTYDEVSKYFVDKRNHYVATPMHLYRAQRYADGYFTIDDERYGYILSEDRKSIRVDEDAAKIIREIFTRVGNGESSMNIAKSLNERGVDSPSFHMKKIGARRFIETKNEWTRNTVYSIHKREAYLGSATRTIQGKSVEVKYPPIIDEQMYSRYLNSVKRKTCAPHPRTTKPNALKGKIKNAEDGTSLSCRVHKELPGAPRRYHKNTNYNSDFIEYEKVIAAVVTEVRNEQAHAKNILAYIKTPDGEERRNAFEAALVETAKQLCEHISQEAKEDIQAYGEYENDELSANEYLARKQKMQNRINDYEVQFSRIMEIVDKLPVIYSAENPWVKQCLNCAEPIEPLNEYMDMWIEKVLVYGTDKVQVFLRQSEWKKDLLNIISEVQHGKEK